MSVRSDGILVSMFTPFKVNECLPKSRPEDTQDKRLGHLVEFVDSFTVENMPLLPEGAVVILGYADDRGVDRNNGRTGAFAGPDTIRRFLYRLTPSYRQKNFPKVFDLGNLKSWSMDLAEAHDEARKMIHLLRKRGVKIITLGGGHDWAYPDYVDFGADFPDHSTKIVNVDAHLDMRPNPKEPERASHSGTPFRKIIESAVKKKPEISVVGLQEHCNSPSHIDWAHSHRVSTLFLEEIPDNLERRWPLIEDRLQLKSKDSIFGVSIDMDAFPQFMAPGTSAPQAIGIDPRLILHMVRTLGPRVSQMGIYEFNPRYDIDDRTARLAAMFVYNFIGLQ
jgi:formiminoglutamase